MKTRRQNLISSPYLKITLAGLAFAMCFSSLWVKVYRAQTELRDSVLKSFEQDLEKRAAGLSYFYSERKYDLKNLPAKREISIFFENKALGMSMEFGLKASLIAMRESLDLVLKERMLGQDPIYTRFVFVDSSGECLFDSQRNPNLDQPGAKYQEFLTPRGSDPVILVKRLDNIPELIVSSPYFFKGTYSGQIIAWISIETMEKHLIGTDSQLRKKAVRIFSSQDDFYFPTQANGPDISSILPNIASMGEREYFNFKMADGVEMISTWTPIKDTPLFLVGFIPAHELLGYLFPWHLVILAPMSIFSLLAGGVAWWTITRKKAYRENELILKSVGEGLFGLDRFSNVTFVNPAALDLTGFEIKEVMGRNLHELIHNKKPDGTPYPREECPVHATLMTAQKSHITDDVFWTKGGTPLPVAYLTTPINQDGQIVGVVVSFRDITWRKQAEAELKRTDQDLEKVFDGSTEGIGIVDSKGLVRRWNKAAEGIYGYTFEELQGKPVFDQYADKEELAKMLSQLRRDGYVKNYEITMKRKDTSTFPSSLSIKVLRDENGENMGSVTVARDLTEVKDREAKLHSANEQLQALVDESKQRNRNMALLQEIGDVFQSCRTSGETYSAIAHFMPQFFPSFGGALYILNESKNLFEMTSIWGDNASLEMMFGQDECWSLRRTRAYLVHDSKTCMNCRHVSSEAPGSYLCVPMMAQGEIMGIFYLRKDTPEDQEQMKAVGQFATTVAETMALALANLKLRETLRNQAIRDGLTGLFNRRYMDETLERELSRNKRQKSPLGVIMMDLDHFKEYNDTYGHTAGDELLVAVGRMIQDLVRREDVACRYGGEEFLLIIPDAPLEVALERAQILTESVKRLHTQNQALRPITISAGVAIFPDHGANAKEVIRAADAALYRAKEEGRDRVVVAYCDKGHGFSQLKIIKSLQIGGPI